MIHRYTNLGFELDVYIPSIKVGIEYDGVAYHKNDTDIKKNKICNENNITLIRVREEGLCSYNDCICIFRKNAHDKITLNDAIIQLFSYLNIQNINIDVLRDYNSILQQYKLIKLKNSLAIKFPEIAKEWHPILNGTLLPENFSCTSHENVWWLCQKCGHEWQTRISARTGTIKRGCGCCTNKVVVQGKNDFETWCKENDRLDLLSEWDYEENEKLGITPQTIVYGSGKKVFWKSENNTSYQRSVYEKTRTVCIKKKHNTRKIRNIDTSETFDSIKEAETRYNIAHTNIIKCCKGERKTAGGYHWEYVDEENNQEKEEM